jgi:hypothetical protein
MPDFAATRSQNGPAQALRQWADYQALFFVLNYTNWYN